MALDPLSAIVNGIGLIMDHDAKTKAADAAGNNAIWQRAVGLDNLQQQYQNTNNMLGINDQLMQFLQQNGIDTTKLVQDIVADQNRQAVTSENQRVGSAQGLSDERVKLANALGNRDIEQARASTAGTGRAARADRQDAFGNVTYYDPATGGFKTSLDPTQTDLTRGYTEAEGSRLAGLNEALARERFDRSPSEASIRSELTGLMTDANAQKMNDLKQAMGMIALRTGTGNADPAAILKAIDDRLGSKLPQTLLDARNQAASEYMAREQARRAGSSSDIQSLREPLKVSQSIEDANTDRRSAIDNLQKTLASNATLNQSAAKTAGDRVQSAQDKGFDALLSTLSDAEKAKLATGATGNALLLNNQSNNRQGILDALKQRIDIWSGNAARTQNAYATGMGQSNTASAQNVGVIGKESPNSSMLSGLAKSLSTSGGDKSDKSDYSGMSNDDIVNSIMEKMAA